MVCRALIHIAAGFIGCSSTSWYRVCIVQVFWSGFLQCQLHARCKYVHVCQNKAVIERLVRYGAVRTWPGTGVKHGRNCNDLAFSAPGQGGAQFGARTCIRFCTRTMFTCMRAFWLTQTHATGCAAYVQQTPSVFRTGTLLR